MAGGLRRWSAQLDDNSRKSALRHAGEHGAQGLLNARDDARQKLIDEPWFGRDTVSQDTGYDRGWSNMQQDSPNAPDERFSGTVWGSEGHNTPQQQGWDAHQAQAHELYGHDEQ